MIPSKWTAEYDALLLLRHKQEREEYELAFDEVPITDDYLKMWGEQLVTPDDLLELTASGRGEYTKGDTRTFVIVQEEQCGKYNCWMRRAPDGSTQLLSEHPLEIITSGRVIPDFPTIEKITK